MVDLGNAFFACLRGECTAADVMALMDARQTENLSDGGHIVLSVTELPHRHWQYSNFRFVVQGNGYGMTEEYADTIFVMFIREETPSPTRCRTPIWAWPSPSAWSSGWAARCR